MNRMRDPFLLPLQDCTDPAVVGGKAAGLGRLLRKGVHIPAGVCLTSAVYRSALQAGGLDPNAFWNEATGASDTDRVSLLDDWRRRVGALTLPPEVLDSLDRQLDKLGVSKQALWAVRSSASEEDAEEASFGGMFRTLLGVNRHEIPAAVAECWASLWSLPAWVYRAQAGRERGRPADPPTMAVVLQPLLAARSAGVAYSRHPVTGRHDQVVINAVFGLADVLVSGEVTPDQYVVEMGAAPGGEPVIDQEVAEKTRRRVAGPGGLVDQAVEAPASRSPVLDRDTITSLARLAKQVEQALDRPVDIEWAIDAEGLWLLQARPIPFRRTPAEFTSDACTWSRANFRETLPDVPSPFAAATLQEYMETAIISHYRKAGCHIPCGLPSVRLIRGRPYINVTLMQSLMAQLGGDPAEVTDLMGGDPAPPPPGVTRLPWGRLVRAGLRVERQLLAAPRNAPAWFAEMRRLGRAQLDPALSRLSEEQVWERLLQLNRELHARDLTFAFVGAVSQALTVLRVTLQRRLGENWRPFLNAATRGFGTIISAQQILRLMDLAEQARQDPTARAFLMTEQWEPEAFRGRLAGTPFLEALDRFLEEYGHRAVGESDVRSPRFSEEPAYVLGIIRGHLLAPSGRSAASAQREQAEARETALREIRRAFGWRVHEWLWFRRWHEALACAQTLREANRHHLMFFLAGVKRLLLLLGGKLAGRGLLDCADDLFFLLPDEIRMMIDDLPREPRKDWKRLVASRRAEWARHAGAEVPDVVTGRTVRSQAGEGAPAAGAGEALKGMPISAGYAEGPVRLIRSPQDLQKVTSGEILVLPVIDPGMAPLLGLAAGLVIEMGGMLSHGAIIAREYGVPAIANVRQATRLLKDGDRVAVDATAGEVKWLAAS